MKYTFAWLVLVAIFFSFQEKKISVKQFEWLEGTWKQEGLDAYEQWEFVSDTLIRGASFHLVGNDYVRDENIKFLAKDSYFYYIPLVFNQNKQQAVSFKVSSFTPNSFIAENPAHDFPQRIVYTLTDANHLQAYIEGEIKGKNKRIDFFFVRE